MRRALIRHGIDRLPRSRSRRPSSADVLDDRSWLSDQYRTHSAVEIADETGVSTRTVYVAMRRHGIARRHPHRGSELRQPALTDAQFLDAAIRRESSTAIAAELGVSAGTVTAAYRRAGIKPESTPLLFERGRKRSRPDPEALRMTWAAESTYRGVARNFGISHSTAAVWLAEVGIFAKDTPAISHAALSEAITNGRSLHDIAVEHRVALVTVRVELHRHDLFAAHRTRHLDGSGRTDRSSSRRTG